LPAKISGVVAVVGSKMAEKRGDLSSQSYYEQRYTESQEKVQDLQSRTEARRARNNVNNPNTVYKTATDKMSTISIKDRITTQLTNTPDVKNIIAAKVADVKGDPIAAQQARNRQTETAQNKQERTDRAQERIDKRKIHTEQRIAERKKNDVTFDTLNTEIKPPAILEKFDDVVGTRVAALRGDPVAQAQIKEKQRLAEAQKKEQAAAETHAKKVLEAEAYRQQSVISQTAASNNQRIENREQSRAATKAIIRSQKYGIKIDFTERKEALKEAQEGLTRKEKKEQGLTKKAQELTTADKKKQKAYVKYLAKQSQQTAAQTEFYKQKINTETMTGGKKSEIDRGLIFASKDERELREQGIAVKIEDVGLNGDSNMRLRKTGLQAPVIRRNPSVKFVAPKISKKSIQKLAAKNMASNNVSRND
jgi:hypothetical protein